MFRRRSSETEVQKTLRKGRGVVFFESLYAEDGCTEPTDSGMIVDDMLEDHPGIFREVAAEALVSLGQLVVDGKLGGTSPMSDQTKTELTGIAEVFARPSTESA